MQACLTVLVFICAINTLIAQSTYLENPSFEGDIGLHQIPDGWLPCKPNSTPDTGPIFGNSEKPSDGESYLHMVTRGASDPSPETTEACQTKLLTPLQNNNCYRLRVDLSRSAVTQVQNAQGFLVQYDTPCKLTIYGGSYGCHTREVLWESPVIEYNNWQTYEAILHPKEGDVIYLILEANFDSYTAFGNVCIDNMHVSALGSSGLKQHEVISKGDEIGLEAGSGAFYSWEPQEGLSCTNCASPEAMPQQSTLYTANIVTVDGCSYQETFLVEIQTTVFVANIFSPNNDGNNDKAFVRVNGNQIESALFSIYSRWGEKVFETRDISVGWDGIHKGTKTLPGVYSYVANIKTNAGEDIVKSGSITLVR